MTILGLGAASCLVIPLPPSDPIGPFERTELVGVQPYDEGCEKGVPSSSINPLTIVLPGVKCRLDIPSLSLYPPTSPTMPSYSCSSLPLLPAEFSKVPRSGRSASISSMMGSTATLPSLVGMRVTARRDAGEESGLGAVLLLEADIAGAAAVILEAYRRRGCHRVEPHDAASTTASKVGTMEACGGAGDLQPRKSDSP